VTASAASRLYRQLPVCIDGFCRANAWNLCPDWCDEVYRDYITPYSAWHGRQWSWTCPNRPLFVALFFALLAAGVPVIYSLRYPLLGWVSSSRILVPFHDVYNDPAGLAHWFWQVFVALQASNDALSAAGQLVQKQTVAVTRRSCPIAPMRPLLHQYPAGPPGQVKLPLLHILFWPLMVYNPSSSMGSLGLSVTF